MVDALGNAVRLALTGGQQADCPQLPALLDGLPQSPGKALADKDYATNSVLAAIACHEAEAVVPPKTSRAQQHPYDEDI